MNAEQNACAPDFSEARVLIRQLGHYVGQEVTINGWIDVRRDQGKLVFFDFRDRTGFIQGVVLPAKDAEGEALMAVAKETRHEDVVEVRGIVNKRPEKNVQADKQNGDLELEIKGITVLTKAQELPFDKDAEVTLETRLDYRPYTLRSQRDRDIFTVQATILKAFRDSLDKQGFTEFQAPALVGGDAEGGAAVFEIPDYFGKRAFLATSGQLYKQIMVGPLERVMTVAKTFRAEKSATTRHLSEITQLEFEMGFIKDDRDVMRTLERTVRDIVKAVTEKHADVFTRFGIEAPLLGDAFPALTLAEAHKTLGVEPEDDMSPEHERAICEWAKKEHGSDFVFITRFPTQKRAFYTYADPNEPEFSLSFDLLFRGLEINSGSQRIHDYDELVAKMESRGMDPDKFAFYLQAFKYGLPPHGGCSTGLERITGRMLELANVKEAVAFPRDMHRIDNLLSHEQDEA